MTVGSSIWRILAGRTKCQTLACPLSLPLRKPLWNSTVKTECTEFEVYLCLNPPFKWMMKGSNKKFALAVCEFSWGLPECGVVLMETSQKWLSLTALFLPFKPSKAGKTSTWDLCGMRSLASVKGKWERGMYLLCWICQIISCAVMNIFIPVMGKQNSLYINLGGGMNGIGRVFRVSLGNWIDLQ